MGYWREYLTTLEYWREYLIIIGFGVAALSIVYLQHRDIKRATERMQKTEELFKRVLRGENIDVEMELRAIYGDRAYERMHRS
ncbi:MAG TPA: hypothetical protein VHD38_03605 [Candidatus Paceibacterota bacterium]|nr:hypothetical protein [Candidatus Paceibacterota bacterium]